MPELEHAPGLIDRLARVHEGNAAAHLTRAADQHEAGAAPSLAWSQHLMLAASGLVISASYWSLIAPGRAVEHYRQATGIFRALGHSYWMVLALASANESDIALMPGAIDETPDPSPQAVAFAMIGNEVANADRSAVRADRLTQHWRHFGNTPIGRLGIPLDHYVHCAQAMRAARTDKDMGRFVAAAAAYLHRAAEVIRSASHDRFHWLSLQSTILPAEPEAVAIVTAMSMMSHALFSRPMSEIPNLDAHGRRLVEIGDELREAGRG
jgi:hypothetical protein